MTVLRSRVQQEVAEALAALRNGDDARGLRREPSPWRNRGSYEEPGTHESFLPLVVLGNVVVYTTSSSGMKVRLTERRRVKLLRWFGPSVTCEVQLYEGPAVPALVELLRSELAENEAAAVQSRLDDADKMLSRS